MSKDVLIAGGVVVVCVALVVVALTATGKKKPADEPLPPIGSTYDSAPLTPPSSNNPYGSPAPPAFDSGFGGSPSGGASLSGGTDPLGSGPSPLAPAPGPAPSPLDGGAGGLGPSPLAQNDLLGPAPAPGAGSLPPVGIEPVAAPAATTKGGGTHVVAKGETLGDISAQAYGSSKHWRKIVEANPGLDPARLKIGQSLTIPAIESAAPAAAGAAGGGETYTVKAGESYYTIAKKVLGSASRWRELERLNNVPAESLKAGTVLKLPAKESAGGTAGPAGAGGGKSHIVGRGETLGDISKQYFGTTTKWKKIVEANPGLRPEALKVGQQIAIPDLGGDAAPAGAAPEAVGGYTVKAGDTLETIAAKEMGAKSAWKQIVEANPGLKPTSLRIGQKLVIPGAPAAAPVAAPAAGGLPGLDAAPAGGLAPVGPPPKPVDEYKNDPFYSPYDALPPAPAPTAPGRTSAAPAGQPSLS